MGDAENGHHRRKKQKNAHEVVPGGLGVRHRLAQEKYTGKSAPAQDLLTRFEAGGRGVRKNLDYTPKRNQVYEPRRHGARNGFPTPPNAGNQVGGNRIQMPI